MSGQEHTECFFCLDTFVVNLLQSDNYMTDNSLTIRKAVGSDVDTLLALAEFSRQTMRANGNILQWPVGYPSRQDIETDMRRGDCHVLCGDGGCVVGSFVFRQGPDPTYRVIYDGAWTDNERPYHVIHRVMSLPTVHGIFAAMMAYCFSHCGNIRIDTHRDNTIMRHLIVKYGFRYCGIIHTACAENNERLAFQWLGDGNGGAENKFKTE